jgi:1-acyl-sn-glycerol-3-phosphate acyltransferase
MSCFLVVIRLVTYIGVFLIYSLIGVMVHILFFISKSQRFKWISFFTHWWAKTTCWVLNFQFEIIGENFFKSGSLIVSNHIGTPDIFILGACFKGFFVSKVEISDWPFFNLLAWLGMTIFTDRKNKWKVRSIIQKIETRLNADCSVILFPESQATDPGALQYHDGNQPTIAYYGDSFFKHMITLLKNPRLKATVFILPEISAGPSRHQLAKVSYESVRRRYLNREEG